jgi:hypothetical protein
MVASQLTLHGIGRRWLFEIDTSGIEGAVYGVVVWDIEPPMQSGQAFIRHVLKQHVLKQVDMEVYDVELIGVTPYLVEHHGMRGNVAADSGQPQTLRHASN